MLPLGLAIADLLEVAFVFEYCIVEGCVYTLECLLVHESKIALVLTNIK